MHMIINIYIYIYICIYISIVDKAMKDLDWAPKYSMLEGLKESYNLDFSVKKVISSLCTHLSMYLIYPSIYISYLSINHIYLCYLSIYQYLMYPSIYLSTFFCVFLFVLSIIYIIMYLLI